MRLRLGRPAPFTLACVLASAGVRAQVNGSRAGGAGSDSTVTLGVRVVDVVAGRAFVEPGSDDGLREGDEVRFEQGTFRVVATTKGSAAVDLRERALGIGARGSVRVPANRPERVVLAPPKPAPLASFRGQWRPEPGPAAKQRPAPVPLRVRERSPNRLVFQDAAYGAFPLDGKSKFIGHELRGRLHYEPLTASPLGFALDLGIQTFTGDGFSLRPGAPARQIVRVREASVAYGRPAELRGALGRLRAASTFVGELDGLRVDVPLAEGASLSAFGGTSPQTFNGMISAEVMRTGAELAYEAGESSFRPRLVLGGQLSRFESKLDDRKLYASLEVQPSSSRFGGFGEVSFFDADNPWRARPVELTAAGLDGDVTFGAFHVGGRAEVRRPDRSRYLQSLLPLEWFCWADPALARAPCSGDDGAYLWLVDAGARIGKFSVDIGGQSSYTVGTDASNFGGFTNLRFLDLVGPLYLDLGGSAQAGSLLRSLGLAVAPGVLLAGGDADLSVHYRGTLVRYRADIAYRFEHVVGADLWASVGDSVMFALSGDWLRARELSTALVQVVVTWRPLD